MGCDDVQLHHVIQILRSKLWVQILLETLNEMSICEIGLTLERISIIVNLLAVCAFSWVAILVLTGLLSELIVQLIQEFIGCNILSTLL